MPSDTFPTSTLELSSLQDLNTPSILDIRPFVEQIQGRNAEPVGRALIQIQQAFDLIQQVLRSSVPSLESISIASADIGDLTVSGQFGPGNFDVLNGPPNYDEIGWIGSKAKAASVTITNIVAGLVTTAAPHTLKPGDNVYIESTTVPANTGFYVVATTPLATTFTATGGIPGGNSTGGDMTKQFQGEWVKSFAAGGTAFDNAPFIVDVDGSLTITNATIILIDPGSGNEIILDPSDGSIVSIGPTGYKALLQAGNLLLTPPTGPAYGLLEAHALTFRNLLGYDVVKLFADPTTGYGRLQTYNHDQTAFLWIDPESGADAISGDSSIGINLDNFKMNAGKIKRYDNSDTAGLGVPAIYASIALTAQTASIGATDLQVDSGIAPAGLYRVTFYYNTTTAGSAGIVFLTLTYTDDGGAKTASFNNCSLTILAAATSDTWTLWTTGVADIQFTTTVSGAVGSPQYSVRVILERLS